MRKTVLILFLAVISHQAFSQSLSPTVIASAGGHFAGGNAQISWTLGEPVIETVGGANVILTQGFHQSTIAINSIGETDSNFELVAFPNPANDLLNLRIANSGTETYNLEIFSIDGRLVFSSQLTGSNIPTQIDLSALRSGSYHVAVSDRRSFSENFILIKY